jgi:uncharacterized protein YdaU (DUF1376 family)
MAKESYYFSHDYSARSDPKIKKLMQRYGFAGYGIFWAIVEDLYQNANALPMDSETIAYDLRVTENIVSSIINDFDLFVIDADTFGSTAVERRLNERNEKSAKARKSALKKWENVRNNANAKRTQSDANAIKVNESKEDDSKEEESKETINIEFENFRLLYPGTKRGYDSEFENLKKKYKDWKQICAILNDCLDKQIAAKETNRQNGAFVPQWKNLQTYINQKAWEEVIPIQAATTQNGKTPEKSVFLKNRELYNRTQPTWFDPKIYDENVIFKINQL